MSWISFSLSLSTIVVFFLWNMFILSIGMLENCPLPSQIKLLGLFWQQLFGLVAIEVTHISCSGTHFRIMEKKINSEFSLRLTVWEANFNLFLIFSICLDFRKLWLQITWVRTLSWCWEKVWTISSPQDALKSCLLPLLVTQRYHTFKILDNINAHWSIF